MRPLRFLALAAIALLATQCAPVALTGPVAGIWTGIVNQPGIDPYHVEMQIPGIGAATTFYEELACGGALVPLGETAGRVGYRENILFGGVDATGAGCVDGGGIRIGLNADGSLDWRWFYPDDGEFGTTAGMLGATATLRRR